MQSFEQYGMNNTDDTYRTLSVFFLDITLFFSPIMRKKTSEL